MVVLVRHILLLFQHLFATLLRYYKNCRDSFCLWFHQQVCCDKNLNYCQKLSVLPGNHISASQQQLPPLRYPSISVSRETCNIKCIHHILVKLAFCTCQQSIDFTTGIILIMVQLCPTKKQRSFCILDFMQTTFFYLERFLKKLADEQCSSRTKHSVNHIDGSGLT